MFVVGVANQVQGSDISVPPRTRQQGQEYRPKQQRDLVRGRPVNVLVLRDLAGSIICSLHY